MDLSRLEYPKHLLEHSLSDQELAAIPPDKQAMAKDWNKLRRQNEWMLDQLVSTRNVVVKHDEQLEFWGRVRWLIASVCAIALTLVTILNQMGFFKK